MAKCKFCGEEVPQKEMFKHWNEKHPDEVREMRSKGGKIRMKGIASKEPTPKAEETVKHQIKPVSSLVEAAMLEFVGRSIQVPNTPALIYGYFCAKKMGFEGTIAEFLNEVIDDFFEARGINYYREVMAWQETGKTITPEQQPELVAERA